ncbi:acyltransferase [bacterium]|nr:acyltransferase [bacterium]
MARLKQSSEAGFFCPAYVGLRCFLLFAVLEGHYWIETYPGSRVGSMSLSVPCFFALSGFLISHTLFSYESMPARQALTTFYWRRILRILPAYLVVLAVTRMLWGVPYLFWNMAYLLNWKIYLLSSREPAEFLAFLNLRNTNAIHFWSVCVEEQFYLLYPLFVFGSSRARRTGWLLAGIVFSILCRCYLLKTSGPLTFFGGLPMVAGEYILWGCLFAWFDFRDRWRWLRHPVTLYGCLLAVFCLGWWDPSYRTWAQWRPPLHQTVYCILIAGFVASLRHNPRTLLARFLAWKPFAWIGTMSYGAYLVHSFLNPTVDRLVADHPWLAVIPTCPRAFLGPVLTIAAAAVLWFGFEKPVQRLRRKFSSTGSA